METAVFTQVFAPNDYGYYDLKTEDGRKVSTKDRKFADHVSVNLNKPLQVELAEVQKGDFTNIYLNAIEGVEKTAGGKPRASNGAAKKPTGAAQVDRDQARQKDINAQWAVRLATEVELAGDVDVKLPFDVATMERITTQAKLFIAAKNSL